MGLHHLNVGGVFFNTQLDNDRKLVEKIDGGMLYD